MNFVTVSFVENYNQKCHLPPSLLLSLKARIGNYILIQCATKSAICKIFVKHNISYIQVDDTVSTNKNDCIIPFCKALFPQDFRLLSCVSLNKIKVNVIFKNCSALINWESNNKFHVYIKNILSQYGVISNYVINCKHHPLGNMCGISKILVLDTYQSETIVGKIDHRTVINIQSISSEESLFKFNKSSTIYLGGLEDLMISLSSLINYHINTKNHQKFRVLLKGPSGCGKSSLVKKIAQKTGIQLIYVRYTELSRMNVNECKKFFEMVKQAGEVSSIHPHILFIDNIANEKSNKKEKSKCLYLTLSILDMCIDYKNIFIFGATSSLKPCNKYLKSSKRFVKEIYIGVPTLEQRESILQSLTSSMSVKASDIKEIARETPGYVGSDLSCLVIRAQSIAYENHNNQNENIESEGDCQKDHESISINDFQMALKLVKPSLLQDSNFIMDVKSVYWDDIGGLENIKKRAKMYIEWPVLHPTVFSKVGLPCPKGVLLFGPPGCCKTTLVRVLATECKATFLSASPAQIYSSYVGDSERSIIELFRQARLCAPSIIFLDEIESLVGRRSYLGGQQGIQEKVLSTLLNEMDGFGVKQDSTQGIDSEKLKYDTKESATSEVTDEVKSNENVLVVGATNRIDLIDDALLRPGRFDTILYVPPPTQKERKAILQKLTKGMHLDDNLLEWLSEKTDYFSGADLQNLHRMAAFNAIKSSSKICKEHFQLALSLINPSITKFQLENYENLASKYGQVISA